MRPRFVRLFNHRIGASEQRWWHRQAERLGGHQVDDQIELGRLLDWNVGRLCPAENPVDIVGGTPMQVWEVCPIGYQTSLYDEKGAL